MLQIYLESDQKKKGLVLDSWKKGWLYQKQMEVGFKKNLSLLQGTCNKKCLEINSRKRVVGTSNKSQVYCSCFCRGLGKESYKTSS
jgi:hypothetical protein